MKNLSYAKKGKICLLASFFWPVSGDAADYPYNIARILKESNQDFIVQTPNIWPDGRKIERPERDEFRGIPIQRLRVYANLTWFVKLWFPQVKEYNIMHVCGGYRHPYMFIALLRRGKSKFLLSAFYPLHPQKNPLTKLLLWLVDHSIGRYAISQTECCFAETKQESAWLKKMGAKKIVMMPNALPAEAFIKGNADKFRKKHRIKGRIIFMLGRHVPIKNFDEAIGVLPELAKKFPDLKLVIAGEETKYTEKCRRLAQKLGVSSRILWAGSMNSEEKRDAYAACNIFVLPSFYESRSLAIVEAMAQGKPVLATRSGGLPGVVPDKFCLYKQGNKEELTGKITNILKNKTLAAKLGKKAREEAKKHNFENMKKVYIQTLNQIAK